ncbi:MAG: thiamine phosphate synthase [Gammaproteobacteria bacterium]|nr:MAG: thiamine phosphate synthase [Gammaproteobacteria bacterium]
MKASRRRLLRGLYAITDATLRGDPLAQQVERAIVGGARVIQYRDKGHDAARREAEARALLAVCRRHGVPLLINDDVELAARIGAQGVHIGRDDAHLTAARARLGPRAIIGVSCYNRLELAREAVAGGADYVAFGRFFPSESKPDAVPASPRLLAAARAELDCPLVAIGGITAENGRPLIEAGADMLAVIRGVFAAPDVTLAARRIAQLFNEPETAS